MTDTSAIQPSAERDTQDGEGTPPSGETSFDTLNLEPSLMRGIEDLGFEYCSPIQARILPYTLEGHDVAVLINTYIHSIHAEGLRVPTNG